MKIPKLCKLPHWKVGSYEKSMFDAQDLFRWCCKSRRSCCLRFFFKQPALQMKFPLRAPESLLPPPYCRFLGAPAQNLGSPTTKIVKKLWQPRQSVARWNGDPGVFFYRMVILKKKMLVTQVLLVQKWSQLRLKCCQTSSCFVSITLSLVRQFSH